MQQDLYSELSVVCGDVSRETYAFLLEYQSMFLQWNQRINLIAPSTEKSFWSRHILDSAQLMRFDPQKRSSWIDLGSGGGLPGMVIGILLRDGTGHVTLVESNRKKTAFLHAVRAATGAKVSVLSERIEDAVIHVKQPDLVTARALAPLGRLLDLSFPLFGPGTRALFPKGRGYKREIEESGRNWDYDLVEHASAVDDDSVVLEISRPVRR